MQPHATTLDGTHVKVAVIGAGFAGIGAAIQLMRHGEQSFLLLERAEQVGGTWRDNIYPGVACDIPSHLYSFSFAPECGWHRYYATGSEILKYLIDCAAEPGVAERIRLSTTLRAARWNSDRARWVLTTNRGQFTSSTLVLGTGRFGTPHIPEIPGLASFPGPVCHSSRWDTSIRSDMKVAVVGSGASAIQIVPALAQVGAHVVNIQRSAPWIIPKDDRPYSLMQRRQFGADEGIRLMHRKQIFDAADAGFEARVLGSPEQVALREVAMQHLHAHIRDRALAKMLTPNYEIGCKRVLLSDDFYTTIASGRVSVYGGTINHIEGGTLNLSGGSSISVDALVFATGFEASRPLIAAQVQGRNGLRLDEHWKDGMVSYGSTVVSGFPNMFLLGGPNGALGHNSAIVMMETQIQHLLSALQHLETGWDSCEVRSSAEKDYTRTIYERAVSTVWLSEGCTSWYRHERSGRLSLIWPGTAQEYTEEYSRFNPERFHLSRSPEPNQNARKSLVTELPLR